MSGQVIFRPEQPHVCAPGWTYGEWREDGPMNYRRAHPPSPQEHPRGTVWQCECGRTFVSTGPVARNAPGIIGFRPERRGEKRRRLRGAR